MTTMSEDQNKPDKKEAEETEGASSSHSPGNPVEKQNKRAKTDARPKEIGGRDGPDPTRYGDWEKAGRCIDF